MMATVKLGQRVKDRISGIEGIVIARTEWLYGCTRLLIQPQGDREGKPIDSFNVDEPQCEPIPGEDFSADAAAFRKAAPAGPVAGRHGDRPDAQRAPDATR